MSSVSSVLPLSTTTTSPAHARRDKVRPMFGASLYVNRTGVMWSSMTATWTKEFGVFYKRMALAGRSSIVSRPVGGDDVRQDAGETAHPRRDLAITMIAVKLQDTLKRALAPSGHLMPQ